MRKGPGAVRDFVQVILTDVEMPEMDGYLLTRNIKADPRFHRNPGADALFAFFDVQPAVGHSVGVDEYIPKFEPHRLSETLAACCWESRSDPHTRGTRHAVERGSRARPDAGVDGFERAARQRRCAHPAGRFEPDGDPAVLTGHPRTFGINVFKVREVSQTPDNQDAEHAARCRRPHQPARQRHPGVCRWLPS
jgi:CheY-like chemotaxis protein